jgi:MscS family membrane protein
MEAILEFEIMGSKLWRILALFGIILVAFLIGKIAKYLLKKSGDEFEMKERFVAATTLHSLGKSAVFLFVSFGITISLAVLELQSKKMAELADTVGAILLTIGIGYFFYWLSEVPSVWFTKMAKRTESKLDDMMAPVLRKSLRVSVVILVLVQIAQILSDKPITSIIAGLGIGGLAIALAAQDSIKNFFGSIVLFVDKPFEIGDRVIIDGHDGTVEIVGFRSTKIRTLAGDLVTVPNGELANKTIQNIGKRPYIKRVANITITYDTPPEKIDRAIEILKEILHNHEGMHADLPPRIFFSEFNPDSLNIIVFYWYHPPDYWEYMAFTERFNKEVFRRFNEEGIEFAFPTQTVYLAGDNCRPLTIGINNNKDTEMSS